MKKLQRVVWSKGMFLMPQHFQAQDEYFDQTLQFRFTASNFANWGFCGLGVDEASLANGLFTLRHGEGILPDGLIFDMPACDELPVGRPVEEYFAPTQETLGVYLAIPEARIAGLNYSLAAESVTSNGLQSSTRFVAETQLLPDQTAGADEKPIHVARKTFRLLFEGENLDGFTCLRVAEISRSPGGKYILSPKFIPPLLDISASDYLLLLARRQVEILTAKSSSLAAPRREKGRAVAEFTTSEVASFWLLHTVNSYLPELKHIWKVRRGHPDVLYRAMLRLAGSLSTFSLDAHLSDFPDYDHDNLSVCFNALDLKIRALLETVLPSKCVVVPLHLGDTLVWSGSIVDERHLKDSQFVLSVSCKVPVDELIAKFPRLARVAAPGEVNRLVRNALPGIVLRHLAAPPAAIPLKLDNQYFGLTQAGPLWDGVVQSRSLSVFVPAEIAEPKLELMIVLQ
jgi:type VI secretion system protein ImpJ